MFSFTEQPVNWRFHCYRNLYANKPRACRMNCTLAVGKLFDGHCSFVHFLCLSHSEHLLSSCLASTVRVACASMMLNVQRFHSWFTFFPMCVPRDLRKLKFCKWNTLMLLCFCFFSFVCSVSVRALQPLRTLCFSLCIDNHWVLKRLQLVFILSYHLILSKEERSDWAVLHIFFGILRRELRWLKLLLEYVRSESRKSTDISLPAVFFFFKIGHRVRTIFFTSTHLLARAVKSSHY